MDVFAANDLSAFRNIAAAFEVTTAGRFDATYTHKAIAGSALCISTDWINPTTGAVVTLADGWFHAECYHNSSGSSGGMIFQIYDENDIPIFRFVTTSTGAFRVDYWNGAAWITSFITGIVWTNGTIDVLDVHWTITATHLTVTVYVDESEAGDGTVASVHDEAAAFQIGGGSYTTGTFWSQFLVSDTNTIGAKVGSLRYTGAGNYTEWSGGYADVDETSIVDSTVIDTDVVDDKITFATNNISALPSSEYYIAGLWMNTRGRLGTDAPTQITPIVRVDGTDYDSAYELDTLDQISYEASVNCFPLNPDTGLLWELAEINAAEPGYKAIA